MKPARLIAPVIAACLGAIPASAAVQPLGCLIEPYQVAEVGSPVIGRSEERRVGKECA